MSNYIKEGIRKVSWQVFHFNKNSEGMTEIERTIHKIKKVTCPSRFKCPLEPYLFSNNFTRNFISRLSNATQCHNKIHEFLILELKTFVAEHDLIIKESDKNAGICIMNKIDYDAEVYRQLYDQTTYRPSVRSEYNLKLFDFTDKIKHLSKWFDKSLNIKKIIPDNHSPAKFYILPKIHKHFEIFPAGRPISSTIKCANKGTAMFLDKVLQPISLFIPDLLIDSPHLLLLLQHVRLDPKRKYILVTADISAMYLELPINICKQNCLKYFRANKHLVNFPFQISEEQFKLLLDLCLDYSFLEYNNEIFFQHRGIQMGNSASVSIANITAAVELENLKSDLIAFKRRFIDDILMILDVTDLETPVDEWLNSFFQHKFLKFTYEYSANQVTFLDLSIKLNENNEIDTSLYRKPISKHEFVHFSSNHPKHLLKSLPYSCGLRAIRSCSDTNTRNNEISLLMNQFKSRGYPTNLLASVTNKLETIDRNSILKPKSPLLIKHLSLHNPEILDIYIPQAQPTPNATNQIFVVLPFYNNIRGLGRIARNMFLSELNKCRSRRLRNCILDLKINIAFSIPNSLSRFIQCVNENH